MSKKQWGHGFHQGREEGEDQGIQTGLEIGQQCGESAGRMIIAEYMNAQISAIKSALQNDNEIQAIQLCDIALFYLKRERGFVYETEAE